MKLIINPYRKAKCGPCDLHYLDSGSFSLWTQMADKYATPDDKFRFYKKKGFRKYLDDYARFVKTYAIGIDLFSNVDVIPNPELTWRSQEYLEKEHGLSPIPVVHYKTDMKWLDHYLNKGYPIIALGGLVGSISQDHCIWWIDRCFERICATSDKYPCCRVHGFGITSFEVMTRFPWFSVDSTSWTKAGAYGGIYVPQLRGGEFVFTEKPNVFKVSHESPSKQDYGQHYHNIPKRWRAIIRKWLEFIEIPLGRIKWKKEKPKSWKDMKEEDLGVITAHHDRRAANLLFFEHMRKNIPGWNRPWQSGRPPELGVFHSNEKPKIRDCIEPKNDEKMRIFYSGFGHDYSEPEIMLGQTANIMLTFWDQKPKESGGELRINKRLRGVIKARKKLGGFPRKVN